MAFLRRTTPVLVLAIAGCGSDAKKAVDGSLSRCVPRPPATNRALGSSRYYRESEGAWVVGRRPVFLGFYTLPPYRARTAGAGSYVGIYRTLRGPHGYVIKVMTILAPRHPGELVQSIHRKGKGPPGAAMRDHNAVSDKFFPVGQRRVRIRATDDPRVPGSIYVPGPGCYAMVSRLGGTTRTVTFPVRFAPP